MPSADHYATAIVAAALYTRENPESFVDADADAKFRHFAFHALLSVFPKADRSSVAAALGAPGKPGYFHRSSMWHILGEGPHRTKPIDWWSDEALALVIKAIQSVPGAAVPRSVPTVVPRSASRVVPVTPKAVETISPRTGLDRFAAKYSNVDQLTARAVERRVCRDLLAEAAANTAKLQKKLPRED